MCSQTEAYKEAREMQELEYSQTVRNGEFTDDANARAVAARVLRMQYEKAVADLAKVKERIEHIKGALKDMGYEP